MRAIICPWAFHGLPKRRDVALDDLPHELHVHTKVGVRQAVAHPGNVGPRYGRISFPDFIWHALGRLADDVQTARNGVLNEPTLRKADFRQACGVLLDGLDRSRISSRYTCSVRFTGCGLLPPRCGVAARV